jgi:hypothetical protein
MPEEQKNPEEQRRSAGQRGTIEQRQAEAKRKAEETKTYRVKEGQTWGTNPPLQAGDTVELTEAEAAGFEDKLEPADGSGNEEQAQPPQSQPPATGGVQARSDAASKSGESSESNPPGQTARKI